MTTQDDRVLTPEDQLHADLCALAFGELEGEARTALESRLDAEPEVRAEYEAVRATIKRIDPMVHAGSRTFGVEVSIPNPDGKIPAGIMCTVSFGESP